MSQTNIPEISHSAVPAAQPAVERAAALQRMIGELLPFSNDERRRLIEMLSTFFELDLPKNGTFTDAPEPAHTSPSRGTPFQFSEHSDSPSPKEFMLNKSPKTDVERVACLAYYLARYRGTPHFKTRDISVLNTESAHRPFSNNAALAVENATKMGYLVPSVKGSKQISAAGEQFVEALPDRNTAKEILERFNHRRASTSGK
ncbi:MAG TPA: hypothetical protein VG097_06870, partial [Gemmata sp.]|nr:hypothetical protein [Gemmata sp.]